MDGPWNKYQPDTSTVTPPAQNSDGPWSKYGGDASPAAQTSAFDYYVKNPALAAGKAYINDAKDIGNALTHPIDTLKGVGNAITHPIDTIVDTVKNLPDTVMNHPLQTAGMVLPGAEGAIGLAEKGVNAAKTAITEVGSKNLENRIFGLYNSSVGAKAKNLGDVSKIQPQRVSALKAMSDNLPNVTLESGEEIPKNRYDLAQTLRQTKQAIWNKVSDLSGGATDAGAKIDMAPIVQKAVNDTVKSIGKDALIANPNLLKSLQREASNVSNIGITTPSRAQVYMATLNKELKPMFNSGQAVDYSVLDFKRNLVNHLNDATESAIEDTLNKPGYGALRDQYAALKSSEKEIVAAANKYLRQEGGQGGGIAHPIVNLWSIEEAMQAAGHAATGNIPAAGASLLKSATIKMASKLADFMKNPDNKIPKMFELLKKYNIKTPSTSEEAFAHGPVPDQVNAELMPKSISAPVKIQPKGLPNDYAPRRGPNPETPIAMFGNPNMVPIPMPGTVPKGLPNEYAPRRGVNRPWENRSLPSPRQSGQSSGPVIKQGTSYKQPPNTERMYPKTDFGNQLKYQMQAKENVPLHPAEAGRAELARIYPPAVKGNPNIAPGDLEDFNAMKDWELSQESGGVKVHGGKQTGPERTVTASGSGHSEAFKKVSGNSEKNGFDLLKRAANGEEMTNGERLKIKMMIHDFRKNIKPKMGS